MPKTAKAVVRAMNSTKRPKPTVAIQGDLETAVARKLESRGIARVSELPDDEPQPQWYDLAIEAHRQSAELEMQREARRQAEREAALSASSTLADALRSSITGQAKAGGPVPLNGAAILRTALAGGQGTVNGGSHPG